LDVGAAHGYLAEALRSQGFQVTGLEADGVLGVEAAKHCDKFLLLDLDGPLPHLAHPFDLIVFGDVLEHLKDPAKVLRTFTNRLSEGGSVIVSLPNVANFYVRLNLLFGRFDYQDRGILDRTHLHFFTRKSFRHFLEAAGLEITTLTATPIPLPLVVPQKRQGLLFGVLHSYNAWLARTWQTLFGYQFVAVARKREDKDLQHAATA
jgi:2-polyprenyl-3-methyl-5-hydroxy-6-metoxy-1,4-benzoquinol methylase